MTCAAKGPIEINSHQTMQTRGQKKDTLKAPRKPKYAHQTTVFVYYKNPVRRNAK